MSYEIRTFENNTLVEAAAVLDHAILRAKKLTEKKFEGWLVVVEVERYSKRTRAFALLGKAFWSGVCHDCEGSGKQRWTPSPCTLCNGFGGAVLDKEPA